MIFIERFRNVRDKARKISGADLKSIRTSLLFFVMADLVGVYWYLGMKSLGIAIMMVIIVGMAFILMLERDIPEKKSKGGGNQMTDEKKPKEKPDEEEKPDEGEEQEDSSFSMFGDSGLPNSEEYNKRAEKALVG